MDSDTGEIDLFESAMRGQWDKVIGIYEKEQRIRKKRITGSGATALHIAVSDGTEEVVRQLVKIIAEGDGRDVLKLEDERGNTPLHLAAALGRARMCNCIADVDKTLIGARNRDGETPFFLAALHGHKDAFFCLHRFRVSSGLDYADCRRNDGETILHCTISGDHFVTNSGSTEKEEQLRDAEDPGVIPVSGPSDQGHQLFPPNYEICFEFVKLLSKATLVILGFGSNKIKKIREKKQKHTWSVQILDEILKRASMYRNEGGVEPQRVCSQAEDETIPDPFGDVGNATSSKFLYTNRHGQNNETNAEGNNKGVSSSPKMAKKETPILIAAKNGIIEIVEKILDRFPVAIHDMNSEKKNIVLLTVENRQPDVYRFLLKRKIRKESVFRKVDCKGNGALHLAATLGDHKPWLIPGAALQMQWEIRWYEFVKNSMPFHFVRYNKQNETPRDVFTKTHEVLVKAGGEWLKSTSESCSVVAALIATVTFATSTTVPGGVREESGTPTLENQPAFNLFAISSLVALCFSVTAVVMFLSILTSRYQERDFGKDLPRKLLFGLTSLFVSIASMLLSFCAGHFFVLKDKLRFAALPVYAVTCLPVTLFAFAQFPLYFDLVLASFKKVPQRSYKSIPP